MNINEIERLTYEEAKKISIEEMEIKEHQILFVEINGGFGYSVLVFKDGKHIYYANDYELHHGYMVREEGKEALRQWYIDTLNNKLYTDSELMQDVKSYYEYEKKSYFLRNYYIMRYDYVTAFYIGAEQKKEIEKEKKNFPFFNPVSFCYVNDESIISTQTAILNHLESEYAKLKESIEFFREMVSSQLSNHEAGYTGSYSDALEALGLSYDKLTDEQKKVVKEELNKQIESTF